METLVNHVTHATFIIFKQNLQWCKDALFTLPLFAVKCVWWAALIKNCSLLQFEWPENGLLAVWKSQINNLPIIQNVFTYILISKYQPSYFKTYISLHIPCPMKNIIIHSARKLCRFAIEYFIGLLTEKSRSLWFCWRWKMMKSKYSMKMLGKMDS